MPGKQKPLVLGRDTRKCQPRLRMIANGDVKVNTVRAEQCASIAVSNQTVLKQVARQRFDQAVPMLKGELPRSVKRGSLKQVATSVLANVFIETLDSEVQTRRLPGERARRVNLVTAQVPLSKIRDIAAKDDVIYIELGEPLATPTPVVSADKVGPPSSSLRKFGTPDQRKKAGNVLIGIIDVQGFDFSHPDFLDGRGKTRFVRIWDQGGSGRPSPSGSPQFAYGAELRPEHLNAAISAAPQTQDSSVRTRAAITDGRWVTWDTRGQHCRRQSRRLFRGDDRGSFDLAAESRQRST